MTSTKDTTGAKPIILRDYEAQALAQGRLGAVVRAVKPQPELFYIHGSATDPIDDDLVFRVMEQGGRDALCVSPHQPGNALWVKEGWCELARVDSNGYTHYDDCSYYYRADGDYQIDLYDDDGRFLDNQKMPFKSPITMPREACRHLLTVKAVSVCRVQELNDGQMIEAGAAFVQCGCCGCRGVSDPCTDCYNTGFLEPPILDFTQQWDKHIKPADRAVYGYKANPWAWFVEVERVTREK